MTPPHPSDAYILYGWPPIRRLDVDPTPKKRMKSQSRSLLPCHEWTGLWTGPRAGRANIVNDSKTPATLFAIVRPPFADGPKTTFG